MLELMRKYDELARKILNKATEVKDEGENNACLAKKLEDR